MPKSADCKGVGINTVIFCGKLINLLPVFITNGGEFMSSLQISPIKHPRPVVPSHQTLESLEISKRMLKTERHRKDQCPITDITDVTKSIGSIMVISEN